jgi:hypothetical protein
MLCAGSKLRAQGDIIFSDSLAAHAQELEIDVDFQSDGNRTFNIGSYKIMPDPEMSGTYSDTKERLLGLRVVTKITKTVAFTISNPSYDTAMVFSEERTRVNAYYPNAVLENFFLDEITAGKYDGFSAWISIKADSNKTWTLFTPKGKEHRRRLPIKMILTDGENVIELVGASSDAHFDYTHPKRSLRKMPAMGVEFFENGKSICALQYDAGLACPSPSDMQQSYGCKVWMRRGLGAKTELMLAAAMSTMMLKNNSSLVMNE